MAFEKGAHDFINSSDEKQMAANNKKIDFILNTIPVAHEVEYFM